MKLLVIALIGAGGTLAMDLWGTALKFFGLKGLSMAHLGRWILSMPGGKWFHHPIGKSPEIKGEVLAGWIAHYSIGVAFAFLFVSLCGVGWLQRPLLRPALLFGLVTVIVPFTVLQPALGLGYFASRADHQWSAILRSLGSHTVFGIGLYLAALRFGNLYKP